MKPRYWFFAVLLSLSVCLPLAASAEAGEAAHHFDWMGFAGKAVNSTILFGGLFLLLRRPVATMLRKTSAGIQTDLADRRTRADEAIANLEVVARRLAGVESEVEAIHAAARERGRLEGERLAADGRAEAERIVAQAQAETERRLDAAKQRIRERVADDLLSRFTTDFLASPDFDRQ
ncbi:MAG TPA: ATP synthase F0 subunit B, partial [Candidatus Aminicenantes bacterium]|nr:ATP synthase F0 subunit B [Candidatus Aminicenantes bacterium]